MLLNDTTTSLLDTTTWNSKDYVTAIFTTTCFILGITGNVFALTTSLIYQSINLDRVSIALVRQIAVVDVMFTINTIMPTMISAYFKRWVLGDFLCDATAHFNFVPCLTSIYLVCSLSLYKFLVCMMPFRMRYVKPRHAKYSIILMYMCSSVHFLLSIFLGKTGFWMGSIDRCISMIYLTNKTIIIISTILCIALPILLLLIINVWMYGISRRMSRSNVHQQCNYQALITVCSISGLFILSWAPKIIYIGTTILTERDIPVWAVAISHYFPFISSVGNPIVYTITNKRYGQFVRKTLVIFKVSSSQGEVAGEVYRNNVTSSPAYIVSKDLAEETAPVVCQ